MPTAAIAAYSSALRIGDSVPLTPLSISAATNTTPVVVTTPAHAVTDVTVVTITGVVGNTGANGTFVAARVSATQLTLRGSAGTGAYTSGGSLVRTETFATIAEVTNIEDAGVTATLVEASAHDGAGYVSRVPTLLSDDAVRLSLNHVNAHATHNNTTGLQFLLRTKARRNFLVVLSDTAKTAWYFGGWVTSLKVSAPVAGILSAAATVTFSDVPILSAA